MITVAIVGILASVAYPAYTESVLKGKRAQARTALLELAQQQERYMTQFNCYLPFTTDTDFDASATAGCDGNRTSAPTDVPFKVFAGESTNAATYRLSASQCTASGGGSIALNDCILLTATPLHSDPKVANLTLNSNGAKSCTGTSKTSNPALCWP